MQVVEFQTFTLTYLVMSSLVDGTMKSNTELRKDKCDTVYDILWNAVIMIEWLWLQSHWSFLVSSAQRRDSIHFRQAVVKCCLNVDECRMMELLVVLSARADTHVVPHTDKFELICIDWN